MRTVWLSLILVCLVGVGYVYLVVSIFALGYATTGLYSKGVSEAWGWVLLVVGLLSQGGFFANLILWYRDGASLKRCFIWAYLACLPMGVINLSEPGGVILDVLFLQRSIYVVFFVALVLVGLIALLKEFKATKAEAE